jgi:hypothetical protein
VVVDRRSHGRLFLRRETRRSDSFKQKPAIHIRTSLQLAAKRWVLHDIHSAGVPALRPLGARSSAAPKSLNRCNAV